MALEKMSSRQRRHAGAWLLYYNEILKRPQRGVITYGGGISVVNFIETARAEGYLTTMTPQGVELR